ncbi:MAG: DUF6268 family outer membrane beta-barrel protein [Kiritimatiellaeota bacterium]|nr:DUF6268 family outer membrane beta-barrel protein [Kiritimatiellota bacterium]
MIFRFTIMGLVALAGASRAQTPAAAANVGQSRAVWDTGGRARIVRENLSGGLSYVHSPTLQSGLMFDHEVSRYEFDGPAVDPTWVAQPGEMRVERASVNVRRPLDKDWSLFAAADTTWALARGASYSDAFTWGGMVSARGQVATNFALTFGVFAHSRLEARVRVLPIPGIEWQISEDWKLATAQGLTLTRKINRQWQADFSVLVENREYRMPAEKPFDNGIFRDRSVPLVTSVRWAPNPGMFVQFSVGVSPWQQQRLTDRADAPDLTEQSHWSPSLAATAGLRF